MKKTSTQSAFSDVAADHPQLMPSLQCADAGIFSGDDGKFNPNGEMTRAQLAKVLVEAFDLKGSTANFLQRCSKRSLGK